jgi:hypothetical protein
MDLGRQILCVYVEIFASTVLVFLRLHSGAANIFVAAWRVDHRREAIGRMSRVDYLI